MEFKYKTAMTLEERRGEFEKVSKSNPNKVCIICEKAPNCPLPNIDKTKYLINEDITLPQFSDIIRKKIKIDKNQALFFLVNGKKTLAGSDTMRDIYDKHKDKDGFLYIAYAAQEVWG